MNKKLIAICWRDSAHTSGWHNPEHAEYSPLVITSLGYVVKETDEYVALAQSRAHNTEVEFDSVISIPKAVIEKTLVINLHKDFPK